MTHCQASLFQNSLHIEQRLAGLFLDSTLYKNSSSRVNRNLARGKDEISALDCLAIWPYC